MSKYVDFLAPRYNFSGYIGHPFRLIGEHDNQFHHNLLDRILDWEPELIISPLKSNIHHCNYSM